MLARAGSWVGNTIGGLTLARFWYYQTYTAGSGPSLTLTTNQNGNVGSQAWASTNVVNSSAVATDVNGNPLFTSATNETPASMVTVSSHTAAAVVLSGTPASGLGVIYIWYLYAASSANAYTSLQLAPDFVWAQRSVFLDNRYLLELNNLSDLTSASAARTNLGLGALATLSTSGSSILKGNGSGGISNAVGDTDYQNPISLGAVGSTANANGMTFTSDVLNLQPASTSYGGVISTGAQSMAGAKTWTGAKAITVAGVSGLGGLLISGAPYSAGNATTNYPQLAVVNAATSSTWNINGTYVGVNAATGFTGNLLDMQLANVSQCSVSYQGAMTLGPTTPALASPGLTIKASSGGTAYIYQYSNGGGGPTILSTGNNGYMALQNNSKNIMQSDGSGHASLLAGAANGAANIDSVIIVSQAGDTTHSTLSCAAITSQTGNLFTAYAAGGTTVVARISVAGIGTFTAAEITAGGTLKLDGSSSGYVTLASSSGPTSYGLVFPTAQGTLGQTFSNDGSGNLSWATVPTLHRAGGTAALAIGATSIAITITTGMGSTNYRVNAQFVNTTDGSPEFQPIQTIAKSNTSFTLEWNDGLPTGNYTIDWIAVPDYNS